MEDISITLLSTFLGIIATVYTMQHNMKRHTQETTTDNVAMREEIKYISKGVEDIKYDMKTRNSIVSQMDARLIRAEENISHINEKLDSYISSHP